MERLVTSFWVCLTFSEIPEPSRNISVHFPASSSFGQIQISLSCQLKATEQFLATMMNKDENIPM